jgi:two-component system cell cycle sensor histidine kinase/response regulator CckA
MTPYEQIAKRNSYFLRPIHRRHFALRYGFALVVTGAALALSLAFPLGEGRPYYFLIGGVLLATWYAGIGPGLLSAVLSSVLGLIFVFLPEAQVASKFDFFRYIGFAGSSFLIFGLVAAWGRAREAAHKANLYFGGVVQISEDAIMSIDENQNIRLFNPGAEKIFGYRAEEIIGKPLNTLLPERFRALHLQHVKEFGRAPDVLRAMNARGTIFGRRADGSEFPAEASISKFEAGGERVMTVRLRDVTERHATEQRLRQMASIVESSPDAIISEDLKGVITSWNPGAEKLYGYAAEEAIGRDARMLLPPGAPDEVSANVEAARRGESFTTETIRRHKSGQLLDVALTVSPIRDRSGNVVGVATIVRDIAERKRLEHQLLHSQKMEAIGRLAGGVAHDFNNLLSIIVGYTYLIQSSTSEDDPLRAPADQIMAAAEKAGALTRQLLAFSRKQMMRPEVVDLNEVSSGIARILPRLLGEDIDVRIVAGENLHNVKADPGQIEQVIMNLVVNARDAMPEGGKLTIETSNITFSEEEARQHGVKPGDYVLLAVSDTGHGMDEQTRSRIFEPFFTTKSAGKGTGLGLAMVYGIVSQSNGHIWVYSEPGQGTTFKIYFPATEAATAKAQAAHAPELSLCGKETVLLVEDEDKLRELLAHVLREKGYQVIVAASGADALRETASLENRKIDLLLTDVIMPEMRGYELAEKLIRKWPAMAVIYMSGYTDNALIHSGALPKGTAFLQKPFTPNVVLRRIRELLNEVSAAKQSRRKAV